MAKVFISYRRLSANNTAVFVIREVVGRQVNFYEFDLTNGQVNAFFDCSSSPCAWGTSINRHGIFDMKASATLAFHVDGKRVTAALNGSPIGSNTETTSPQFLDVRFAILTPNYSPTSQVAFSDFTIAAG